MKRISQLIGKYGKGNKRISESIELSLFKKVYMDAACTLFIQKGKKFVIDDDNKRFLLHFSKYWSNDPSFEINDDISLQKGLFVKGSIGTGKTTSFEIIRTIYRTYKFEKLCFPIISAEQVVEKFNSAKNKEEVITYYSNGTFFFDDLGKETAGNNIYQYGKEEIFIRILSNRYRNFESKGTLTHITSNLDFDQIGARYGTHIQDRFYTMFNQLKLSGASRR